MLGKIAGIIVVISSFFAIASGNVDKLAESIISGAGDAVSLTLALVGMMCLWCGILQVLKEAGVIKMLTKIIRPMIKIFFPSANKYGEAAEDIAANIAANMLGVGNAATPLALSAMEKLQRINPNPDTASADMITLAVLNTASFSIVPSTVITLMKSGGSSNPFAIIVPIWITSISCSLMALILCRLAAIVRSVPSKVNQVKINKKIKQYENT